MIYRLGEDMEEPDFNYEGYTAKDYRAWDYKGYFEIIRGKVYRLTPPGYTSLHQSVFGALMVTLHDTLIEAPYVMVQGPFEVYLTNQPNKFEETDTVVMPDMIVSSHKDELKDFGYVGVPDLIIEIISARTAQKDLSDKFKAYEYFGVQELWTVFLGENCINQYKREQGAFVEKGLIFSGEHIQSICFPEIKFEVAEIFKRT
jgi:Uma2 family endonuclease